MVLAKEICVDVLNARAQINPEITQKALSFSSLGPEDQKTVTRILMKTKAKKFNRRFIYENSDIDYQAQGVEIGAIVLTLKNGKRIEIDHTSSHAKQISPEDFNKSFYTYIDKHGLLYSDIISMLYVHSHPRLSTHNLSPLSQFDLASLRDMESFFKEKGIDVEVNMMAVEPDRNNGEPLIWSFK